eukprot:1361502-Amphidinium_carterae.1
MEGFLAELKAVVNDAHWSRTSPLDTRKLELAEELTRLRSKLAHELVRLNVSAMEPQKDKRSLKLGALPRIDETKIVAGELVGEGMFAVRKGLWQPNSEAGASSSSSASGSLHSVHRVQVALKEYKVPYPPKR